MLIQSLKLISTKKPLCHLLFLKSLKKKNKRLFFLFKRRSTRAVFPQPRSARRGRLFTAAPGVSFISGGSSEAPTRVSRAGLLLCRHFAVRASPGIFLMPGGFQKPRLVLRVRGFCFTALPLGACRRHAAAEAAIGPQTAVLRRLTGQNGT